MNTFSLIGRHVSGRLFAALTIISLVLTAFPAAFFVAEAATVDLLASTSKTITGSDPFASGAVDASGHENLVFSFSYDSTKLDGTNDSFTYGWRDVGGDNDLATIVGQVGASSTEVGTVSVNLPAAAQVSDLEVYAFVTAVPGNASDEVVLTDITVVGDEVVEEKKVNICHWNGVEFSLLNVAINSIGNAHGSQGSNDGDIVPVTGDYAGQNLTEIYGDVTGAEWLGLEECPDVEEEEEDLRYGPYCGDGVLNQEWEQCDSDKLSDDKKSRQISCSDQCQFIGGDMCTDLTLAKIDIENVENKAGGGGDMTDNVYLGGVPIPNDAWFALHWNGIYATDADVSNYEDVPGLAVQRSAGELRTVMYGTQTGADEEHIDGNVEFWSWDDSVVATALRSDNSNDLPGNNKLEGETSPIEDEGSKGNAGDDEVWLDNGEAHFWLTTTTADDGFYTEYSTPVVCDAPLLCEREVNLIENGGFEAPVLSPASWSIFYTGEPLLAWLTGAEGVEIQNNVAGSPFAGSQHAELDPHHPTMIWQEVATIPGETYKFSAYYSPRPGRDLEDNRFEFVVDGSTLGSSIARSGVGNQNTDWTYEEREFVATGVTTSVGFAEIGADTSYGAYLDEVALSCVPYQEPDPECTLEAVSDTGTVVVENSLYALETWDEHTAWTASIPGADWVWESFYVSDTEVNTTKTFLETFTVAGVNDATLDVAADNTYKVYINGTLVVDVMDGNNFTAGTQDNYDVASYLVDGNNTLEIEVTNIAANGSGPETNPAGVLYKLVVNAETRCELTTYVDETPDPTYGPYCGDQEINQDWEQCEIGDDYCTDYCTLDNQCSDLQLMKITLDNDTPASYSFDGTLNLGAAGNIIPNGTWFNFAELGDDTANTIANATDGLAIERTGSELRLAMAGGNNSSQFDYIFGNIETKGIELGAVNRAPIPGWPLENGGDFPDVFQKDGSEGVGFEFYLTTGDDAVAVEVNQGVEYDCDECRAEVEARIVLQDGEVIMQNGTGNLLEQVILGDGSVVDFGEWFPVSLAPAPGDSAVWVNDAETVTNFTDPETLEGLFVSREGDGTVKIALYGYHTPGGDTNYESLRATIEFNDAKVLGGSTVQIPGDFKLEDHSETDSVSSNDNFDGFVEAGDLESVDFDLWVDTKADGLKITLDTADFVICDDDTDPREPVEPQTHRIDGYKFEVTGSTTVPGAGWSIYATNGSSTPLSTTTDDSGHYYFDVTAGDWSITEEDRTDWNLVDVYQGGWYVEDYQSAEVLTSCNFTVTDYQYSSLVAVKTTTLQDDYSSESHYYCEFYNEYTEPITPDDDPTENGGDNNPTSSRGGGSSGTRIFSEPTPAPLVLGASTAVSQCPFLLDYMQMGTENDSWEVTKLQMFLNIFVADNPVTGSFGPITDANVKAFQEQYRDEVLVPWYLKGIVPHSRATGFVYKTTLWKINDIICPEEAILPDFVGENLIDNVDIH